MIVDGARVSYASYLDVDKEKQIQQEIDAQYMSAQTFIDSISDTYLSTLRVNVTANKVETFTGPEGWIDEHITNYDDFMIDRLAYCVEQRRASAHVVCLLCHRQCVFDRHPVMDDFKIIVEQHCRNIGKSFFFLLLFDHGRERFDNKVRFQRKH